MTPSSRNWWPRVATSRHPAESSLIQDWLEELKAKVPTGRCRRPRELFRLVNGEKADEDLHHAVLGEDILPSDWVVGEGARGPQKPTR